MGRAVRDLSGQKFGRLTALKATEKRDGTNVLWLCECDCGSTSEVRGYHLTSGHSKSCGCLNRESVIEHQTTHGKTHSKVYRAWLNLNHRCKPTAEYHKDYHDRGITVCPEWRHGTPNAFENFSSHIGEPPTPKHSVDRIDNNKGYEVGNVRWATWSQQNRNRRPYKRSRRSAQEINPSLN